MKQRVISALIGLVILVIVIFFYNTLIFNATMALIALLATYELLNATKLIKYKGLALLGAGFSLLLPFARLSVIRPLLPVFIMLLSLLFFVLNLKYFKKLRFEEMSTALVFSIFAPLFFSSAIYSREDFGVGAGLYYLIWALGSGWLCDTGAYFSGLMFGKHKMAPNISPKKTIEGAVGGLITATVFNLLIAFGYSYFMTRSGTPISINYLVVGLASPFLALIGMLGDLSASVIKRQHDVKDFGHIMPGHGGVMDRFDSVILTLPSVYVLVTLIPVAEII